MNIGPVFIIFMSVISSCVAIKCFECMMTELGAGDPKCEDPFYEPDPPYLKDCDEKIYKKCRKTKTYLANDKIRIVRECAELTCSDKGCKMYDGQKVCELCCYGDMCNGAGLVTFDTTLIASVMAGRLLILAMH